MLRTIFNKIYQNISYTFSVFSFSALWAFFAAFYVYIFISLAVDFQTQGYKVTLWTLVFAVVIANILHSIHFGLFHKLGFSGMSRSARIINKYLENRYLQKNHNKITDEDIKKFYKALVLFPRKNMITSLFYAVIMMLLATLGYYLFTKMIFNLTYFILGGFFAATIYSYITLNITEYLIGPVKRWTEGILYNRLEDFNPKVILSIKKKSIFTLILILFNMILLSITLMTKENSLFQVSLFIFISIMLVGLLFNMLNLTLRLSLQRINISAKDLARGGKGQYFPTFSAKELVAFSKNFNAAAAEIYELRHDLARSVEEKTEDLKKAYDELHHTYEQIQEDMALAESMQNKILPHDFDKIKGINCTIHYYPMSKVGGDLYDIYEIYPGHVRVFLADATGHGIQAALATMIIKGEYEKVKNTSTPAEALKKLNSSFFRLYETLNVFFTCIIIDLHMTSGYLLYSSAGHPDQIFIHNNEITTLHHTGKIIGALPDSTYTSHELEMEEKDKLLLFTDGLFEVFDEEDNEFGEQQLKKRVQSLSEEKANSIINTILSDLSRFSGTDGKISLFDDTTIIGIDITE